MAKQYLLIDATHKLKIDATHFLLIQDDGSSPLHKLSGTTEFLSSIRGDTEFLVSVKGDAEFNTKIAEGLVT